MSCRIKFASFRPVKYFSSKLLAINIVVIFVTLYLAQGCCSLFATLKAFDDFKNDLMGATKTLKNHRLI